MMRSFLVALLGSVVVCSAELKVSPSQSAKRVECYDFVEVTLRLEAPPAGNPFVEAECIGELRPPGGEPLRVHGFCDAEDGSLFRIRFMPTQPGRHDFSLSLQWSGMRAEHKGSFEARRGKRKGLLRVDPKYPTHFIHEGSGEHYFWNGTTTYWLLGWRDEAIIRESLDRLAKLKVNRVRVALNGRTRDASRWREPDIKPTKDFQFRLEPWPAARPENIEDPGYDITRFNLDHFRKAERMLTHAGKRDIIVSVIFHLDGRDAGVDPFGRKNMGGPNEQRYYRYVVARFGAFENVMWDVTNEWHLFRDEPWVEKMGAYIKELDPWDHLTSVHGKEVFPFRKSPWADFAMFQRWDEHGSYAFMLKNRKEQAEAGKARPQVNEEYGYEDHYPYPWGEKRVWPARIGESRVRLAWEMAMAGGYQTTGERANVPNYGGWITGRGNEEMTMLKGYAHLRNFFERVEWWKLEPRPDLVSSNALCLAETGKRYVVYLPDGGSAWLNSQLSISKGFAAFEVTRFDPRSGKLSRLETTTAENWPSPQMPKNENWVFLLEPRWVLK
jgi:uncharacterized protein DUF5060